MNTDHDGFDLDDVTISAEGTAAGGIVLQDGANFSLNNSTFENPFDGDVFNFSNLTALSGAGNTAQNFQGTLFNNGGGNTGALTIPSVDPDGDGINNGSVTIP